MIDEIAALAHIEYRKFHANRAFSDWATAFHLDAITDILNEFELSVVRSITWKQGWAAIDKLTTRLGEIKSEYDKHRNADEIKQFMAEIAEQGALFSETHVRVLPKQRHEHSVYRAGRS